MDGTETLETRLRRYAFHESAHAIVSTLLGHRVDHVSIEEDDVSGGRVIMNAYCMPDHADLRAAAESLIVALVAGAIGESIAMGAEIPGISRMDFWFCYGFEAAALEGRDEERGSLVRACIHRANELLMSRWDAVEDVATELLRHRHVTGDRVRRIVERCEALERLSARFQERIREAG
jgi:ATP-dependent Zn protease